MVTSAYTARPPSGGAGQSVDRHRFTWVPSATTSPLDAVDHRPLCTAASNPRPRRPRTSNKDCVTAACPPPQQLSEEITEADRELDQLVRDVAPALLDLPGVGSEVAGQVLISIGDNADRLKSEAAFSHLCGAAPIPASSGRTHPHRLNRGGDPKRKQRPLRSRSPPHATRRLHPRIRRETNPRRASQA